METLLGFPLGVRKRRVEILCDLKYVIKNMKRLVILLMAILPMAFILSTAEAKPNKQKVVLYVYLHCQDCCDKIMKNIPFDKELKNGVKDIVFDMEAQTVTVTYDANRTDVPALQKAFAKIGKPATTSKPEHKCESHDHDHNHDHHGHQH